jgi:hypothetical protein
MQEGKVLVESANIPLKESSEGMARREDEVVGKYS